METLEEILDVTEHERSLPWMQKRLELGREAWAEIWMLLDILPEKQDALEQRTARKIAKILKAKGIQPKTQEEALDILDTLGFMPRILDIEQAGTTRHSIARCIATGTTGCLPDSFGGDC